MTRQDMLEGLFAHLWADKPRADMLIRDVLVALVGMLDEEGCDFSKLEGHEDLAMWIAHSYAVGIGALETVAHQAIAKAFRATFPEVCVPLPGINDGSER